MEAFGKGLVVEPFLETIIMSGGLIDEHGSDQQKSSILEPAIAGELHLALAYAEPQSRFNLSDVVTEAKIDGDNYILNGYKSVVMNGPSANKIIVSARTSGSQLDEGGITLFIIDANSVGLNKTNYKTVDGRRASDLTIENISVSKDDIIGHVDEGFALLDSSIDRAILAISAEAVGAWKCYTRLLLNTLKLENSLVLQLENSKYFSIEWLTCLWNMNNASPCFIWQL